MIRLAIFILYSTLIFHTSLYAKPDIALEGMDGQQHKFSDFIGHGQWTVLNIMGATCPPCLEEVPELVFFHEDHHQKNASVVAIAIDFPSYGYANKRQVQQFAETNQVNFPLMLSDASITRQLGLGRLEGLPTTYIYNPEGKLVGYQVGAITQEIIEKFIQRYKTDK